MTFEDAMGLVAAQREAWQAYSDAQLDHGILVKMNDRNPVVVTDVEVAAAKKKADDLLAAWSDKTSETRAALDTLLKPFGLTRRDLSGLCQ